MKRGVTLLEVLIAILVASIGLLGAIAIFPVALSQARKGRTADITAVAGESAVASFQAQGMHQRERWIYWNPAVPPGSPAFVPQDFQKSSSQFFGQAFCIDPMLFAHSANDDPANAAVWAFFPAVPQAAAPNTRMRRITLHNGNPALPNDPSQSMSIVQADSVFRIRDELIFDRPADNSLPAVQLFTTLKDSNGTDVPGRRQEEGRLTWFATLVPKIDRLQVADARFQMSDDDGSAQLSDEYVLSIVICRNRPSGEGLHVNDSTPPDEYPWNEWTAKIFGGTSANLAGDFHSGGTGGGEVTITTNATSFNEQKYVDVRSGQWVMLSRIVTGTVGNIQHHQWYRISEAGDVRPAGNRWAIDVSLVGGDWPADFQNTLQPPQWDNITEECDVVIVPSVVHVYERTIRTSR